jgi:hypothetical protein
LFLTSAVGGQLDAPEKNPGTDLIGGGMGPGAGLNVLETKYLAPAEIGTMDRPVRSLVTVPTAILCWHGRSEVVFCAC